MQRLIYKTHHRDVKIIVCGECMMKIGLTWMLKYTASGNVQILDVINSVIPIIR